MSPDALLTLATALCAAAAAACALAGRRVASRAVRAVATGAAVALGALAVTGAWSHWVERYWLEVTETNVPWRGAPLRLAVLGDLHAGRTRAWLVRRAVDEVRALRPDAVLLAGDYVTGYDADEDELSQLAPLRALRAPRGVFAVMGNHDSETRVRPVPRTEAIQRRLEALGATVLRNEPRELSPGVALVGLDEVSDGYTDVSGAFAGISPGQRVIVLAHDWHALRAPGVGRFDLAVTAHTHGGQICVPFAGLCPFAHQARPFVAGLYRWERGGALFVNRGIGVSGVPARIGCRPEVSLLRLGAEGRGGGELARR